MEYIPAIADMADAIHNILHTTIRTVYVLPDHQKQGCGSKIMEKKLEVYYFQINVE